MRLFAAENFRFPLSAFRFCLLPNSPPRPKVPFMHMERLFSGKATLLKPKHLSESGGYIVKDFRTLSK